MADTPDELPGAHHASELMDRLGLSEDELCQVLDADALTLLSGELDHRPELAILLALLDELALAVPPATLKRWLRVPGPRGRPIELLLARSFGAFEDALGELGERGLVIRGGGDG